MIYYCRAVKTQLWGDLKAYLNINGDAACYDWNCSNCNANNEWSFFKVDSSKDIKEQLDKAIVFLCTFSPSRMTSDTSFILCKERFFNKKNLNEEEPFFEAIHVTYTKVTLRKMRKALKYSRKVIKKRKNMIYEFTMNDISSLLKGLVSDKNAFVNFCKAICIKKEKNDLFKLLKRIDSVFFARDYIFSNFYNNNNISSLL